MKKLIIVLVYFVLLSSSTFALEGSKMAADFNLPDLSGKIVKLSDYKGKVVFLHFWATWCPPCRGEMPYLQALYVKLKAKKFEILAVAMDREGKRVVEPFIKKGKYTFKVLLDPKGVVSSPYAIVGIPTTFILDRNGRIVDKIVGS